MNSMAWRFFFSALSVIFMAGLLLPLPVKAATTIYVPDDYPTIQSAVDGATPGDTIILRDGIYTLNVNVNKSLTIQSQRGAASTIVQAANSSDHVFEVLANYVNIDGFTVKGTTADNKAGIYLYHVECCTISNNIAVANNDGIYSDCSNNNVFEGNNTSGNVCRGIFLGSSSNNTITNNDASNNGWDGIFLWLNSHNNSVINNTASNNGYSGIVLYESPTENIIVNNHISANKDHGIYLRGSYSNKIYQNNLINNNENADFEDSANTWNSPEEITYTYNGTTYTNYLGNHWSDYTGSDADGDGIGDTPYSIDADKDSYPLIKPFENYEIGPASEEFWAEVSNTGATLAIRQNPSTSGEVLKRVPDDWVLYVMNTYKNSEVHDGYMWWKIRDVTDSVEGWAANTYLNKGDQNKLRNKTQPLNNKDERIPVILEATNHYYNDENTTPSLYSSCDKSSDGTNNNFKMLRNGGLPIELILAITAQESGGAEFNNEFVSGSGGYGIMQITGEKNKGWGTRIKCYSAECKYYTNTRQGIYANMKDGLRVLQWAYQSASTTHPNNVIEDTVWRYNHGGNDKIGDHYYLKNVANKLQNLATCFGQDYKTKLNAGQLLDDSAKEALIKKLINYQEVKLNSPAELRVYNSQGQVTGLVNGQTKNEISNSDYYRDVVIVFSPSDSYRYQVVGTNSGSYGLEIACVENGEAATFTATNIPIASQAIHQYTIDWDALSQGKEGVTLQIDSNGDGVFERTITADNELTVDEFWPYVFGDLQRGTKLRINTFEQTFQFIAPDKEFLIKKATRMKIIDLSKEAAVKYDASSKKWKIDSKKLDLDNDLKPLAEQYQYSEKPGKIILLYHQDKDLRLSALVIDGRVDSCVAFARDMKTEKVYILVDKPDLKKTTR